MGIRGDARYHECSNGALEREGVKIPICIALDSSDVHNIWAIELSRVDQGYFLSPQLVGANMAIALAVWKVGAFGASNSCLLLHCLMGLQSELWEPFACSCHVLVPNVIVTGCEAYIAIQLSRETSWRLVISNSDVLSPTNPWRRTKDGFHTSS